MTHSASLRRDIYRREDVAKDREVLGIGRDIGKELELERLVIPLLEWSHGEAERQKSTHSSLAMVRIPEDKIFPDPLPRMSGTVRN